MGLLYTTGKDDKIKNCYINDEPVSKGVFAYVNGILQRAERAEKKVYELEDKILKFKNTFNDLLY